MKVALLGPYPLDGKPNGGVECVMSALSSGLAGRPEIELHVVSAVPGLPAPVVVTRRPGLTIHQIRHPHGDRVLWHQPVVRPILHTLRSVAPDVVHAQMAGPYADAALQSGCPAVITLHGVVFREAALALSQAGWADRARWKLDTWYERWIVGRATDLIAINPYVAHEYRHLTRARFHDIPISISERYFDVPAEVDASARILCVARVVPRKDILTLVRAFARVRAAVPAAELRIVGQDDADPAYTSLCLDEIDRQGLGESVCFLGGLHGEELAASYAWANLLMLTSLQETEPGVIAEAMVAGRPVVATRVGGVSFMIDDGRTGRLAEVGDAVALADAVIDLLSHPERRAAISEAARAWAVPRYRPSDVVARTLALYEQLALRSKSARP